MSDSMIERVARKIYLIENVGPPFIEDPEGDVDREWKNYIPEARAILTSIREPTTAILKAMRNTVPVDGHEWEYVTADGAPDDHWRAMIDAALAN